MELFAWLLGAAILVAVIVLLVQLNKKVKKQTDELQKTRQCLEQMEPSANQNIETFEEPTAGTCDIQQIISEESDDSDERIIEEEQDAPIEHGQIPEASAYNTGKSGKVYTKEELELLIRE